MRISSFILRPILVLFVLILILALGPRCGTNTPLNGASETPGTPFVVQSLEIGESLEIPFDENGKALLTFDSMAPNARFVLAFYAFSTDLRPVFGSIQAADPSIGAAFSETVQKSERSSRPIDLTEEFHHFLRNTEKNFPILEKNNRELLTKQVIETAENLPAIGSLKPVKVFNSLFSSETYTTIQTSVRLISPHFIVLRDEEAANVLDDQILHDLVTDLETKIEEEFAMFGTVSDFDQNGRIFLVFTPALNRLGGTTGMVTGYFFGGDLEPGGSLNPLSADEAPIPSIDADWNPTVDTSNPNPSLAISNGGEYIYCHVPDPDGIWGVQISEDFYRLSTAPHTLPHEIQHAINYHMKKIVQGVPNDPGWSNEGQSHFAEDLYSDFQKTSAENPSRVKLCLAAGPASFIGGTGLAERGCSYLFYRYLYEQAENGRFVSVLNGKELMNRLHQSRFNGMDTIKEVLEEDFEQTLKDYFLALLLSGTGLNKDLRYQFSGIDLRAAQEDFRQTVLSGPLLQATNKVPFDLSLSGLETRYFLFSAKELMGLKNQLFLSLDPRGFPGAYWVRIQDDTDKVSE